MNLGGRKKILQLLEKNSEILFNKIIFWNNLIELQVWNWNFR